MKRVQDLTKGILMEDHNTIPPHATKELTIAIINELVQAKDSLGVVHHMATTDKHIVVDDQIKKHLQDAIDLLVAVVKDKE